MQDGLDGQVSTQPGQASTCESTECVGLVSVRDPGTCQCGCHLGGA
ncbi:hypothetical protein E4P35_08730 [Thiopseudomonas sp. 4R-3cl]|nr:hypothetical protein [Salmonella enterica subsp. enterica serovar Typhimurium]TFI15839.1 hypothetical protein E4P35_08730 [Thiopseudomonas sp. 4R-3cl]